MLQTICNSLQNVRTLQSCRKIQFYFCHIPFLSGGHIMTADVSKTGLNVGLIGERKYDYVFVSRNMKLCHTICIKKRFFWQNHGKNFISDWLAFWFITFLQEIQFYFDSDRKSCRNLTSQFPKNVPWSKYPARTICVG